MTKDAQDMSGSNTEPDNKSNVWSARSADPQQNVSLPFTYPPYTHPPYTHPPFYPPPLYPPPHLQTPVPPPHQYPPSPHHHKRDLRGLNSLLSETLGELLPTFRDIQTIEAVVHELDEDAFPTFTRVSGEGISNPAEFVERFLELEAAERINLRNLMFSDVKQNLAVVLFPLPPYITDLLRPCLSKELSFTTTEHPPVHIQKDKFQSLDFDKFRQLLSSTSRIDSLILDGQCLHNVLVIRSSAAGVLELLMKKSLKKIYLHKIPHLPR